MYGLFDFLSTPIVRRVNKYRREHGLPKLASPRDFGSPHAVISQLFPAFEFPRLRPRANLHLTGSFLKPEARAPVPFPYERLDGRPLVYASMGTQQNRQKTIFRTIAAACEDLPVQLVISQGRPDAEPIEDLKGSPIVVPFAPQLELLKRAALTITHAGLNTALESLAAGVPMVAIPITNDQPGVAARIVWSGAGECIPPRKLTAPRLRTAIERVLKEDSYRDAVKRLQADMERAGGASRACEIIESVAGSARSSSLQAQSSDRMQASVT
jgi:zeaxanthin glucosyltransferase